MTFDEAIEKVEKLANFEVGKTTGDIRRDFKLELGNVRDILSQLREEYAPTVEMTNYQKGLLLRYLEDLPFSDLISDVYLSRAGGAGDEHGDRYDDLSDEDIMNAWLHPETIKVVDE